jgi:hypothetical protein
MNSKQNTNQLSELEGRLRKYSKILKDVGDITLLGVRDVKSELT